MKFLNHIYVYLLIGTMAVISQSCKKFIDVDSPRNLIDASTVYENDATATAVIRGIYSDMVNGSGFASGTPTSVTFVAGWSADELVAHSSGYAPYYTNSLSPTNISASLWSTPYKFINNANTVIEGLNASTGVTLTTKNQLLGEAKFIRAFCNFYLVNLFGDIPLVLTSDYRANATLSRAATSKVYDQIITDLKDAKELLAADYSFSNNEKTQPNKWAASALLARAYLFNKQWPEAAAEATAVISNSNFRLNNDLDAVFLKNSDEAIFQLKPIGKTSNTNEGFSFILTALPNTVSLNPQLRNSFEMGDNRQAKWIGSFTSGTNTYYFPNKYKVRTGTTLKEYSMVLRLAEQYLIRAEARAQQNNINGAQADLNAIRNRAGLPNTTASDKDALLSAVLQERRFEFFSEWGQRWLDLKRTATVDNVMTIAAIQKGGTWKSFQQWYPIPQTEIDNDRNLNQNDGY